MKDFNLPIFLLKEFIVFVGMWYKWNGQVRDQEGGVHNRNSVEWNKNFKKFQSNKSDR